MVEGRHAVKVEFACLCTNMTKGDSPQNVAFHPNATLWRPRNECVCTCRLLLSK